MHKIHFIHQVLKIIPVFIFLSCLPLHAAETESAAVNPKTESGIEFSPVESVTGGNTAFALALYRQMSESEDNLFFSPFSLSTALAMTYAGARGNTETQMAQALHFSLPQNEFHKTLHRLNQKLNAVQKEGDITLNIANALWIQQNFRLLDAFLEQMQAGYQAPPNRVDFIREPEKACETVNAWVAEKTSDKIPSLLSPSAITPMTRMVLTNAIYFFGKWEKAFDPKRTEDASFFLDRLATVKTPFMNLTGAFLYAEDEEVQVLHLPYKGKRLSMMLILPKAVEGYLQMEKQLTPERLNTWLENSRKIKVNVHLPKFKIASEYYLSQTLSDMGMPDAFDAGLADFSGMNGKKSLFISTVVHKAVVEVNEEGTEAAAATGVVMTLRMAAPAPATVFRADHPFIFLIRDVQTKSVLFMGRVADLRK